MKQGLDYLGIEIGCAGSLNRTNLRRAIRQIQELIARISPLTGIDIAIGGYDDDPREIFEIPEARRYIIGFAEGMMKVGVPIERFLPVAINVIRCCFAAEAGHDLPLDYSEVDIGQELRDFQARVRRSMQ